jgi:hypothetical protein
MSSFARAACAALLVVASARAADAQLYESVGTRAQGMAGAFVAVADDATATWWNPAGIASGAYFSAVVEHGRTTQPADTTGRVPASELGTTGFSVSFPALGLSYYRLRISEIAAITGDPAAGRQDPGAPAALVRTLVVNQFGATVDQSVGGHLVVATTLKIVRGGEMPGSATADDPLGAANDLDVDVDTRADLDVGAMVRVGSIRGGISVRNLRQPTFGSGANELTLKRKARAGLAYVMAGKPAGGFNGVTVAGDVDVTKTATPFGDVRHVAGGVEALFAKKHVAARTGVSTNTVGDTRRSLSYGFSVSPANGVFVDFARTNGEDESLRGWSSSIRLTF